MLIAQDYTKKNQTFSAFSDEIVMLFCTKVKRCLIVKSGIITIIVPDFATVVGYLSVSRPFLDLAHPRHMNSSHSELLEVHAY